MRRCAKCDNEVSYDATWRDCGFDLNSAAQRLADATAASARGEAAPPPNPQPWRRGQLVREADNVFVVGNILATVSAVLALFALFGGLSLLSELSEADVDVSAAEKLVAFLGAATPAFILSLLLIAAGVTMRLFAVYAKRDTQTPGTSLAAATPPRRDDV